MSDQFEDVGMGPGVKALNSFEKMPEEQPRGRSAVYDRARIAGASIEQALELEARNVYGHDVKKDRKGNYIQQGIGAPGHETANHFASIRRWEGEVPYQNALKEIWKRDPDRARKIGLPEPQRASA